MMKMMTSNYDNNSNDYFFENLQYPTIIFSSGASDKLKDVESNY